MTVTTTLIPAPPANDELSEPEFYVRDDISGLDSEGLTTLDAAYETWLDDGRQRSTIHAVAWKCRRGYLDWKYTCEYCPKSKRWSRWTAD